MPQQQGDTADVLIIDDPADGVASSSSGGFKASAAWGSSNSGSGGGGFGGVTDGGIVIRDPPVPSAMAVQYNKLLSILSSSALVAFVRTLLSPPPAVLAEASEGLPQWFVADYNRSSIYHRYGRRWARDTVAFVGCSYLYEGVQHGVLALRGGGRQADDAFNSVLGGVAAGTALSFVWYPGSLNARAAMMCAGSLVGYLSWMGESTSKAMLLQKQQQLEQELLHRSPEQVKQEVNPYYLRELLRAKQQQVLAERLDAMQQQQDRAGFSGQPAGPLQASRDHQERSGPTFASAAGASPPPAEFESIGSGRAPIPEAGPAVPRSRDGWWGRSPGRNQGGGPRAPGAGGSSVSGGVGVDSDNAPLLIIEEQDDDDISQQQQRGRR